jgi:hypothetical protein
LAIDAGVDFPHLAYLLALGARMDVPVSYRIGAKSRWLLGDVDSLLLRLRNSDADLDLPSSAPSRPRAVLEFMKFAQHGMSYDVLSAGDVQPFFHEAKQYIRDLSASANRGIRKRFSRFPLGRPRLVRPSIQK